VLVANEVWKRRLPVALKVQMCICADWCKKSVMFYVRPMWNNLKYGQNHNTECKTVANIQDGQVGKQQEFFYA
jgi:hypothetical protein